MTDLSRHAGRVAIVGSGCALPGALSPQDFAALVLSGRDVITETDPAEWGITRALADPAHPLGSAEFMASRRGGRVRNFAAAFDPEPFQRAGVPPAVLNCGVSWLLHSARQAVAGVAQPWRDPSRTAVIVGNLAYPTRGYADYSSAVLLGASQDRKHQALERFCAGSPALWVAKAFGLTGSAFCLDAACASSLYALALACTRLADRRIDSALVGGLAMVDGLFIHMGFTALKALSPSGHSRPFHKNADGLLPAEGAAMVLIKRLDDALAAGDPILGVIEAVGLSNDGAGGGLLSPHGPGQVRAMRDAFARTALIPRDIDLIECHATGTPLGDPLELRSTAEVYGAASGMPLGSIKSNMGHLMTASGLAGLLKMLAGFAAEQKPPTLHCDEPLPEVTALGFRLLQQAEPWPAGRPRHAAITNLGFGGNNAHLLLSAPPETRLLTRAAVPEGSPAKIVVVAALARGDGLSTGKELAAAWAAGETAPSADHVDIALQGLKFPPLDLRKSLGQQTLMLAAGQALSPSGGERCGAIVGMSTDATVCSYALRWRLPDLLATFGLQRNENQALIDVLAGIIAPLESAHALGAMPNMPANRLSVQFDLQGPSFTVAAEELTGLAALEVAMDLLRRGNLDSALVGAVDLSRNKVHQAAHSDAGLPQTASPANHAVVLMLKRLKTAQTDNESILAVLGDPVPAQGQPTPCAFERRFGHAHAAAGLGNVALTAVALAQRADPSGERLVPQFRPNRSASVQAASFTGATRAIELEAGPAPVPLLRHQRHSLVVRLLGRPNAEVPFMRISDRASMTDPMLRERLAVVADSDIDADRLQVQTLEALAAGRPLPPSRDIWYSAEPLGGELALMFTGSAAGLNWTDPGLFARYPELIDLLCAFEPELVPDIYQRHIAPGLPDDDPLVHLKVSSLVCQAHSRLALNLLKLEPQATLGLSSGETNSLIAFGFIDNMKSLISRVEDSNMYAGWLSGPCRSAAIHWGMSGPVEWVCWQVTAPRELVDSLLAEESLVSLTIINAPGVYSLCGEAAAMTRLLERLEGRPLQRINSDLVVHTPAMTPFAEQWQHIHTFPIHPQPVRLYGNAFNAAYVATTESVADALTRQALGTVDFPATVERAWNDGVRVFVECGPRSSLSAAVRHTLGDKPHLAISFDQAGVAPERQVARIAAALFTAGHGFDLSLFDVPPPRRPGPVLTLPLQFPEADTRHIVLEPTVMTVATSHPQDAPVLYQPHPLPILPTSTSSEEVSRLIPAGPSQLMKLASGGLLRIDPELQPTGLTLDRAELELCTHGKLSELFGPSFARQDGYVRQVRMPGPPLLLADRVTGIAGEPGTMGKGIVWTESDVPADAWYLSAGRMPPGICIESGQADLLLISWLGADFLNQDERVYRLLGCELVFHAGGLPRAGETLRFQIHVDGHARLGDVRMFFFHYDCRIGDRLLLSVRNGQAGFFSDAELAQTKGVLWSPAEHVLAPNPRLDPPPCPSLKRSFSAEDILAFSAGRTFAAFGPGFEMAGAHQRTPGIPQGQMRLIDEVPVFDPTGGPWGRGYLQAQTTVAPDAWFYKGHFHNDPCMPGTLMADAATQALSIYMAACGLSIHRDGWRFEPVPEVPLRFLCRGQVIPDKTHQLTYEVFVEEFIAGPQPTVYASLLCSSDGLKVFHCPRFGMRLVPDWPLEERRAALMLPEQPHVVSPGGDVRGDFTALMACAWGAPSQAFGSRYARFDDCSASMPHLPGPPYHVMSRIESIDSPPHVPTVGAKLVATYDVPADAWYFADNAVDAMPFSVLLEVLLQPCGWLAIYMGFALQGDLYFRNLDGVNCRALRPVRPDSGTLRMEVTFTDYSKVGPLTLVKYRVSCTDDHGLVMSLETGFGFFPAAALSNQKGLPVVAPHREVMEAPATHDLAYADLAALPGTKLPRLAAGNLRMVDRVTGFWPTGGSAGLGRIRGRQDINPEAWYFKAHFFQDPVQPGSLGLEALIQLLIAAAVLKGLDQCFANPQVDSLAQDRPLIWKYRGQVVPRDKFVVTHLDLTAIETLPDGSLLILADGSLWAGNLRIYEVQGLSLRLRDALNLPTIDPAL